jgi:hypothetical protein
LKEFISRIEKIKILRIFRKRKENSENIRLDILFLIGIENEKFNRTRRK